MNIHLGHRIHYYLDCLSFELVQLSDTTELSLFNSLQCKYNRNNAEGDKNVIFAVKRVDYLFVYLQKTIVPFGHLKRIGYSETSTVYAYI